MNAEKNGVKLTRPWSWNRSSAKEDEGRMDLCYRSEIGVEHARERQTQLCLGRDIE